MNNHHNDHDHNDVKSDNDVDASDAVDDNHGDAGFCGSRQRHSNWNIQCLSCKRRVRMLFGCCRAASQTVELISVFKQTKKCAKFYYK